MRRFVKSIVIALQFALGTSIIMMVYGLVTGGSVNPDLIFNACFLVGAVIVTVGLVIIFIPSRFLFDKLTDHSNITERYREQREQKNKKANEFILLGIMVIVTAGLAQIILWLFSGAAAR